MPRLLSPVSDDPLWEDGEPTYEAYVAFTEGDCWALAWHVALLTGGRQTTLGTWPGWQHVVVDLGPGLGDERYLDVEGLQSGDQVTDYWGPLHRLADDQVASIAAYTDALDARLVFATHHGEVADFARRLVDLHVGRARAA